MFKPLFITVVLFVELAGATSAKAQIRPEALLDFVDSRFEETVDTTGIVKKTKTIPASDAVLATAPTEISFKFPVDVRLVKLTLHNQERDWVDINFRYRPQLSSNFSLHLPALENASYYTAEWAILASNDRLVKGRFSFSFGADAAPPSVTMEAEAINFHLQNGERALELDRALQPTEIIINDSDPEVFDPPFTIQLN